MIGFGCKEESLELATENRENLYVYQLIATPMDVVVISDDEDFESVNDSNNNNDQKIVEAINVSPDEINENIVLHDAGAHDEHDAIVNDAINREASNGASNCVNTTKRKGIQLIEAPPLPMKRCRKFVASGTQPTNTNQKNEMKASEVVNSQNVNKSGAISKTYPSTSKSADPRQNNAAGALMRATTGQTSDKIVKPPTTNEDAPKEIDTIRRHPRRIAHVPKNHDPIPPKSILRQNSTGPQQAAGSHPVRNNGSNVRFAAEEPEVRHFVTHDSLIPVNTPARRTERVQSQKVSLESETLDRLINEITEWNPAWFDPRNKLEPPINGHNFIPDPLMDDYPDLEVYHKYASIRTICVIHSVCNIG